MITVNRLYYWSQFQLFNNSNVKLDLTQHASSIILNKQLPCTRKIIILGDSVQVLVQRRAMKPSIWYIESKTTHSPKHNNEMKMFSYQLYHSLDSNCGSALVVDHGNIIWFNMMGVYFFGDDWRKHCKLMLLLVIYKGFSRLYCSFESTTNMQPLRWGTTVVFSRCLWTKCHTSSIKCLLTILKFQINLLQQIQGKKKKSLQHGSLRTFHP